MRWSPLTLEQRYLIQVCVLAGLSSREIGKQLGRHHSTICDEIARGRDRSGKYCPNVGQLRREEASARSAGNSLRRPEELWREVHKKLARGWSPETIHGRWELLGKPTISTPALYAGVKRHDWQEYLHQNRIRAHLKRPSRRPWPGKARSIHERGEDANLRIERGHWEGDTAVGKRKDRQRLLVIVERQTLYLILSVIQGTASEPTVRRMKRRLETCGLPFKSIATDRGAEFSASAEILGDKALACDAHAPNQRATNENQIGRLRADVPKGVSMDQLTARQVRGLQDKYNHMPRKCLGFRTPYEVAFKKPPRERH